MTIKLGSFSNKICIAIENGSPISTICLTKSKTTPTERETTVKAAIEKNKGVNNSNNNHLSSNGITFNRLSNNFLNCMNKEKLLNIIYDLKEFPK